MSRISSSGKIETAGSGLGHNLEVHLSLFQFLGKRVIGLVFRSSSGAWLLDKGAISVFLGDEKPAEEV